MERCKEFLEKQGHKLIIIILFIQSIIFVVFTLMFILADDNLSQSKKNKFYICGILALFLIFMIHFAYHSVKFCLISD